MSTSTTAYRGIAVLSAMLAAGTVLWFNRSDINVKAVDIAEVCAAAADVSQENIGPSFTNVLFYSRGWEIDSTHSNQWGGYSNFTISASSYYPYDPSGAYTFAGRFYGAWGAATLGNDGVVGGAIDEYDGPNGILLDCGPGGASYVDYWGLGYVPNAPCGWIFFYNAAFFGWTPLYFSPPFVDLSTTDVMYNSSAIMGYPNGIFNDKTGRYVPYNYSCYGANFTFSPGTIVTNRVRTYNPTTLHSYTNTILMTADQAQINAIRAAVFSAVTEGNFIGPTNIGSTYTGATNFSYVSTIANTSSWAVVYTNWAAGVRTVTNVTSSPCYSNAVLGFTNATDIITTNIVYIPNEGAFVTTNELAWHYSAPYRLRDELISGYSVSGFVFNCGQKNLVASFADSYANVLATYNSGVDPSFQQCFLPLTTYGISSLPQNLILKQTEIGSGHTLVVQVSHLFYTVKFSTRVPANIEWYMLLAPASSTIGSYYFSGFPANMVTATNGYTFNAEGSSLYNSTNQWQLIRTTSSVVGTNTVLIETDANFPALPATDGYVNGWQAVGLVPIVRWQQRACNTSQFDSRYP